MNSQQPASAFDRLFFFTLSAFILSIPYNIDPAWVGAFSITLFLLTAFNPTRTRSPRLLLQDRTLVSLFVFILFSYATVLWSQSPEFYNDDLITNLYRFKYYFLIIPAIFLSNLDRHDISKLMAMVAIAPVLSIIIYYTNVLGWTDIFPFREPDADLILSHYLVQNFFILLSILYLYIRLLSAIKSKDIGKASLYGLLFILASISLAIHPDTTSRLMLLAFVILITITPGFYLPKKIYFPLAALVLAISSSVIVSNPSFQRGINSLEEAVTSETYANSWGHRTAFILAGLRMYREHPIIGRGINDFLRPYEEIVKQNPERFYDLRRFHNEHINILVATGLAGYLLMLTFFIALYRLKIMDSDISVFKNMILICLMFIMLGEQYLSIKETTNLIAIMIALFVLLSDREMDESNVPETDR